MTTADQDGSAPMGIQTSLDSLRATEHIVDVMRAADELAFVASRNGGTRTVRVLSAALHGDDQLVAIAAVHALAQVFEGEADDVLSELLSSERGYLREHAAWAFGARLPRFDTVARLVSLVVEGGFSGMLAQRSLQQWGTSAPDHVAIALESSLIGVRDTPQRARLVESLGVASSDIATRALLRIAADESEADVVRVAAVAGLGDRQGHRPSVALVTLLAAGEGYVADAARLAVVDLSAAEVVRAPWQTGLTVAQLFLHADIDPALTSAGSGDNGGIATLLVRLGDALTDADAAASPGVERVITLSRGTAGQSLGSLSSVGSTVSGHSYASVPLLSDPVSSSEAWPLRVAAERGIRRILRAAGTVDVLHLRMADVGSLAAGNVARDLGIPLVFTVAPDPHAVIRSLEVSGALTRENFGAVDEREHYWFRSRLVQRLAADAAHTVLFPRPNLETDMRELVGIDITAHPERHSIVPEGIDLAVVDRAVEEAAAHASGAPASPPLEQLRTLLATLPPERRDLPLLLSVGRLHRVKGMASIVEAWANGPLRGRANLLIVGGRLDRPSADEREQLDQIAAVVPIDEAAGAGLLMPGHQPNDTVARWVAATRFGVPGLSRPGGVYVCGSVKEEFGIAILEAMAAGLIVVAPSGGGPSTYVEQGSTGFLTVTTDLPRLRAAMTDALDAVTAELAHPATTDARPQLSRQTVARTFTIQAMAAKLAAVYSEVRADNSDAEAGRVVSL
jgi:glycosyltransferase involved in cell wall biosynthesis